METFEATMRRIANSVAGINPVTASMIMKNLPVPGKVIEPKTPPQKKAT